MGSVTVSVVTGGAGGLGAAIATRFVALGDVVYLLDRDADAASAVASRLNGEGRGRAVAVAHDVSSDVQNRALIERVGAEHGRLDRLVNNAGIQQRSPFGTLEHDEWSRVLDVNLWSVASLSQAAVGIWAERPGGAVVNMASRAWLAGGPLAYAASKGGVVALTHALAVELGPYEVTVNAVAPSTVPTAIVGAARDPQEYERHLERVRSLPLLPRIATTDDVASTVEFLATSRAGFITGEVVHVAGGSQLAPPGTPRRRKLREQTDEAGQAR